MWCPIPLSWWHSLSGLPHRARNGQTCTYRAMEMLGVRLSAVVPPVGGAAPGQRFALNSDLSSGRVSLPRPRDYNFLVRLFSSDNIDSAAQMEVAALTSLTAGERTRLVAWYNALLSTYHTTALYDVNFWEQQYLMYVSPNQNAAPMFNSLMSSQIFRRTSPVSDCNLSIRARLAIRDATGAGVPVYIFSRASWCGEVGTERGRPPERVCWAARSTEAV